MRETKVEQNVSFGLVWLGGWLFSIGFLQLDFLRGALALFLWPYFLGADLAVSPQSPPLVEAGPTAN